MLETLKKTARDFPDSPGVYLMKDREGNIIYIGKAKNLNKRVRSYFTGNKTVKTRVLVMNIRSMEYIVTENEFEALLLEDSLIKRWTPKYNIDLKDDKTYPSICVSNEDFPRIFRTRNVVKNGSTYYGPFTSAAKLDSYIKLIDDHFPLRKCRGRLKKRDSPCLYYHIGKCSAPCCGKISVKEYRSHVRKAENLLKGKTRKLKSDLEKEMKEASGKLDFEKAAKIRDLLEAVKMVEIQSEVIDFDEESRDYIACVMEKGLCTFSVFHIKSGRIVDRNLFRTRAYGDEEDAFTEFFLHYYRDKTAVPGNIYISEDLDTDILESFVNIPVEYPKEGKHLKIIRMALENAANDMDKRLKSSENIKGLGELKRVLNLKDIPVRIEGFDIAQLSGKHTVASLVSFLNGVPDKKNYRKFKIKTLNGAIDDYEAVREVIARRYTRVINENLEKPDLIIIDGGKGQISAAAGILEALGLQSVPLIGLAKQNEEIFLPGKSSPLKLPETSDALRIVQAVRDEAHRFATDFNKGLREKDIALSLLERIPGIGGKTGRKLLMEFGSLEEITSASYGEISSRTGISEAAAERVVDYLSEKI